jgi:hypothetical protein
LNLSLVFISSSLVSEAFTLLSMPLKIGVIVAGLTFLGVGVLVAPDKEREA